LRLQLKVAVSCNTSERNIYTTPAAEQTKCFPNVSVWCLLAAAWKQKVAVGKITNVLKTPAERVA